MGDGASALAVSSSTRVRFLPVADYHGAPPSLTVRGLDNSYAGGFSSTAGSETRTFIDTTSNGGSTAIAATTATLSTSVTAVNDAPVITSNGSGPTGAASVAENAAAGTWVASVTVSDPDLGDIVSFALVQDGAGRFTIDPATGRVLVAPGALLDFEAQATFDLRLRVTDAGGLSSEQSLRVNLLDVAEPTSPSLPSVPTPEPAFPPSSDAPAPGPAVAGAPSVPAEAEAAASPPAPAPTSTVERNPKSRAGLGDSDAGSAAGTGVDAESAPLAAPVANGDDRRDVGPGNVAGSNPRTNQQPPDATFGVPALTASWGWGVADAPVWSEAWSATSAGNSQDTTMRIGSAAHRASAIEVQGNDAARTSEDRTTPETLGEIVRDPVRVSSVAFSAGFIWWLTRSGGLLMTMLMGIPAWRHIDLLPVLARTIDEDDDEDDAHRTPAGTSPRALHSDAADSELDPSSAAAQAVDGLFDRDRDRDHHRAAPQAITPPP